MEYRAKRFKSWVDVMGRRKAGWPRKRAGKADSGGPGSGS